MEPQLLAPPRMAAAVDPLRAELSELDQQLLAQLVWLRVVNQPQLERLHPEVPGRTLRYRTLRLHRLGLLGRTRPYRDRGSFPHHLWPTNRADALVRGKPRPRRGERQPPNPLFLAHTTAVSELYVVLATAASGTGVELREFRREGEARVSFEAGDRPRAIAPDARISLADAAGRSLTANVEMDLGTMSHARLRTKLDGYLQHAEARSPGSPTPPVLLFLTTSTARAATFLETAKRMRAGCGAGPEIVVGDRARDLAELLAARCWSSFERGGLALADLCA